MRAFLGTVLSIIAVGVLLIAYGLLAPRAGAVAAFPQNTPMIPQGTPVMYDAQTGTYQLARPVHASERLQLSPDGRVYASPEYVYRAAARQIVSYPASTVRPVAATAPATRRATTRTVVDRGRDWKKTAMVIGGTTATGAGIGAIFGGKKGAAIGAAIGGGAGTLYEVRKR